MRHLQLREFNSLKESKLPSGIHSNAKWFRRVLIVFVSMNVWQIKLVKHRLQPGLEKPSFF